MIEKQHAICKGASQTACQKCNCGMSAWEYSADETLPAALKDTLLYRANCLKTAVWLSGCLAEPRGHF